MKTYFAIPVYFAATMLLLGCSTEPDPILFGVQECSHCRMTITERPFAAQIMTVKGRTHSFDAIECMVRYTRSNFTSNQEVRLFKVADQNAPHDMLDAVGATFVISESIPSPMGGNLSAYQNHTSATERLGGQEGTMLTWVELVQMYNNK